MTARAFADTNILIYAQGSDPRKAERAIAIVEALPVISTQVINEAISALIKKYGFRLVEAHEIAASFLDLCEVVPVTAETIREAIRLAVRYQFSHWDSLIVAAALLARCETLYSEDLQHDMLIEGRLKITNPFA
jgi:predicted nucleic acid-binding protein